MTQAKVPKDPQIEFEKWKIKVELLKWFVVSVLLVILTTIIDTGFKDRAEGIKEVESYGKYATELVVLNKDVGPRYLLAQYFSNVTVSENLRKGWVSYYNELKKEVDSLNRKQLANLVSIKSATDTTQKKILEDQNIEINKALNATLVLPESTKPQTATTITTVFIQIMNKELKVRAASLQTKLLQGGLLVPGIEVVNDNKLSQNEIRYYYDSDFQAASDLANTLKGEGIDVKIVPMLDYSAKVKAGIIELWIKNL